MKIVMAILLSVPLVMFAPSTGPADSSMFRITLSMQNPFYSPPEAIIEVRQPVQWINRSGMPHTITHDGCFRGRACAFESAPIHPGEQFTVPSLAAGRYPYHCRIHPFMRGIVIVKPSGKTPPGTQQNSTSPVFRL